MKGCECEKPVEFSHDAGKGSCVKCSKMLRPEWTSNDRNLSEFFGRLAESDPEAAIWLEDFRQHCVLREMAGRDRFGYQYLSRDNAIEAMEEATDGALYLYLDGLQAIREGWDEEKDIALTAAYHFAEAHRYCRMLRQRRRGTPGWES